MADDRPAAVLVVFAIVPGRGQAELRAAVTGAADEVVAGPVPASDLAARVARMARHPTPAPAAAAAAVARRRVGPIVIDPRDRRVTIGGRPLALTRGEYELLAHLAAAPGRVFTKQELLGAIWSEPTNAPTRRLDAQVARLRRRLGDHRALLVTVWGVGYRLGAVERP